MLCNNNWWRIFRKVLNNFYYCLRSACRAPIAIKSFVVPLIVLNCLTISLLSFFGTKTFDVLAILIFSLSSIAKFFKSSGPFTTGFLTKSTAPHPKLQMHLWVAMSLLQLVQDIVELIFKSVFHPF